jgi:hypothetical protein
MDTNDAPKNNPTDRQWGGVGLCDRFLPLPEVLWMYWAELGLSPYDLVWIIETHGQMRRNTPAYKSLSGLARSTITKLVKKLKKRGFVKVVLRRTLGQAVVPEYDFAGLYAALAELKNKYEGANKVPTKKTVDEATQAKNKAKTENFKRAVEPIEVHEPIGAYDRPVRDHLKEMIEHSKGMTEAERREMSASAAFFKKRAAL